MDQQHTKDILDRMETAKAFVAAWYNSHVAAPISKYQYIAIPEIEAGKDVYVTWFSKTLKNWKAMLSTTVDDGRYYEATFNGDKHELYLDVYRKEDNVTIREELVDKSFEDTGYHTVTKPSGYSLPAMQVSPKMRGYLDEGLQHRATEKAQDIYERLAKLAADTTEAEHKSPAGTDDMIPKKVAPYPREDAIPLLQEERLFVEQPDGTMNAKCVDTRKVPGGDWDMHPDDVDKDNA